VSDLLSEEFINDLGEERANRDLFLWVPVREFLNWLGCVDSNQFKQRRP
jgi:hypothetical protein